MLSLEIGPGLLTSPARETVVDGVEGAGETPVRLVTSAATGFAGLRNEGSRARTLMRQGAVEHYRAQVEAGRARVEASARTCAEFETSPSTLWRWVTAYERGGLDGLAEQKQGRVGRRPVSDFLPERLADVGKSMTIEHGSVARAARALARRPDLPAPLRAYLHEGHASKSYVTPSIRAALTPARLTVARVQGPRHARLVSRWTPGDHTHDRAGDIFCADDMTSNIVCWCAAPTPRGWLLGQPQILAISDIGSLRWLNFRLIIRQSMGYTSDDIAGMFGDTFDAFGLPGIGVILEGGSWASHAVKGQHTGIGDDDRIGGLASLGVRIFRSYDPRSKPIEGQFNPLQYIMDRCPGWVGREQRYDHPETIKKQLALCRAGKAHPSEFFMHQSKLADHTTAAMEEYNHERQDGQVCRGVSPLEKWAADGPQLRVMPDGAKWLYRSAMNVVRVTANGVRICQGSGAKMQVYFWDAPDLLVPRQGRKVIVYWTRENPDADACVFEPVAGGQKFIGLATRVQPLSRWTATPEDLAQERSRKQAAALFARTEMRAIQPHLARNQRPVVAIDQVTRDTGAALTEAATRARADDRERAATRREVAATRITADDIAAAFATDQTDQTDQTEPTDMALLSDL